MKLTASSIRVTISNSSIRACDIDDECGPRNPYQCFKIDRWFIHYLSRLRRPIIRGQIRCRTIFQTPFARHLHWIGIVNAVTTVRSYASHALMSMVFHHHVHSTDDESDARKSPAGRCFLAWKQTVAAQC
jgi:hypothetical protein